MKPPPADLAPPASLAGLAARAPRADAAGAPIAPALAGLDALDGLDPSRLGRDRRPAAHWDGSVWHDGAARGVERDGKWTWLDREGSRWWALADAQGRPALRHDGLWWVKEGNVWCVLHDGQPWAWRSFQDWDAQGLFHPGTGTEMIYSRDFRKVAVITPGDGAELFDARTGEELERIPEERMPRRRRPRLPPSAPSGTDPFER